MTAAELSGYLLFVACAFGVIGLVNLLRKTKRWLGAGAVFWGVAALAYRAGFALPWVVAPSLLAVACVGVQARERERRRVS